jgi:hypothetical protein
VSDDNQTNIDSKILRAYFNAVSKLFNNFNEATLTSFLGVIQQELCDDNGQIDIKKFQPDDSYNNLLRAYSVILAIKNSNATYNHLFEKYNELGLNKQPVEDKKPKKKVKIPKGWKVIKGCKKRG